MANPRVAAANSRSEYLPSLTIHEYLDQESEAYRQLKAEREKTSKDDTHNASFKKTRERSYRQSPSQQKFYFNMMCKVGAELHAETGIFNLGEKALVLDTAFAPGAFAKVVLDNSPTANISAITLSEEHGGHRVMFNNGNNDARIEVQFADVTLFGIEFGLRPAKLQEGMTSDTPFVGKQFDLAVCDGQVLRSAESDRVPNVEDHAAIKLMCSQLIFAMNRLRHAGTLVLLLHKVEAWDTVQLLATFSKFSQIQLFKPSRYHAHRSSFYLVAKDVEPDCDAARQAVQEWKALWRHCTLNSSQGRVNTAGSRYAEESQVKEFLEEFGPKFIGLATPIWKKQMHSLQKFDQPEKDLSKNWRPL